MRRSPLFSGIIYIFLALLFTYYAIQNVNKEGWGFFSILLVILATFDFGSGLRLLSLHFKIAKLKNKK
jgi:ABC-type multidrug transport system permease subunit